MTSPQTTPKAEPFVLENVDMTLIPAANRADGVPNTWSDIWKFQVPAGQMMIIGPDDTLSMYLEDTAPSRSGEQHGAGAYLRFRHFRARFSRGVRSPVRDSERIPGPAQGGQPAFAPAHHGV